MPIMDCAINHKPGFQGRHECLGISLPPDARRNLDWCEPRKVTVPRVVEGECPEAGKQTVCQGCLDAEAVTERYKARVRAEVGVNLLEVWELP